MEATNSIYNTQFNECLDFLTQSGIQGDHKRLIQLTDEFGDDPLTVKLLVSYLKYGYQGNLSGLENIPILYANEAQGRGLRRLLSAFENSFSGQPELVLLYLLSLDEAPVSQRQMEMRFRGTLTDKLLSWRNDYKKFLAPLSELNRAGWDELVRKLHGLHLLEQTDSDAGPLLSLAEPVRTYFNAKMKISEYYVLRQACADMNVAINEASKVKAEIAVTSSAPPLTLPAIWGKAEEVNLVQEQLQALRASLQTLKTHAQEIKRLRQGGWQDTGEAGPSPEILHQAGRLSQVA